ncbi:hypothetical protein K523DRAFT_157699 [Schizophyllum commune Tattone D]|nr:hypothetical protein K523DRAFT_157699 [Schizophyllum commune Tattone D]
MTGAGSYSRDQLSRRRSTSPRSCAKSPSRPVIKVPLAPSKLARDGRVLNKGDRLLLSLGRWAGKPPSLSICTRVPRASLSATPARAPAVAIHGCPQSGGSRHAQLSVGDTPKRSTKCQRRSPPSRLPDGAAAGDDAWACAAALQTGASHEQAADAHASASATRSPAPSPPSARPLSCSTFSPTRAAIFRSPLLRGRNVVMSTTSAQRR